MLRFDLDTRANILNTDVDPTWDDDVRRVWEENKRRVRESVLMEVGVSDYDRKLEDFSALGMTPLSVLAFHNIFYRQVRAAFVIGAYYAALVGAGTLGERILRSPGQDVA